MKQTDESVKNIDHSSNLVEDTLRTFDAIFNNIDQVSMLGARDDSESGEKSMRLRRMSQQFQRNRLPAQRKFLRLPSRWCVRWTISLAIVKVFHKCK